MYPFFAVAGLVVGFLGLCLSTYLGLKSISFTRQQLIITNKAVAELDDIANGVKISAEKTYELIGRNIEETFKLVDKKGDITLNAIQKNGESTLLAIEKVHESIKKELG